MKFHVGRIEAKENRKLKQMYVILALDHQMAKKVIKKKQGY